MTVVEFGYLEQPYLSEYSYLSGQIENGLNSQVEMFVGDTEVLGTQVLMDAEGQFALNAQVDLKASGSHVLNSQVQMKIFDSNVLNSQVKFGKLAHYSCNGYLADLPYLSDAPYLSEILCGSLFSQVDMRIFNQKNLNTQTEMKIVEETDDYFLQTQVQMKVADFESIINTQVNMLKSTKLNTSVTLVIYNTTQLRILCEYPSRGTAALGGTNWTSVQAVSAGDFSPNNLNTDIVEERTQTTSIALWQLRSDTGNSNTFADTFAILNHNFTRSARVELSGSDDPAFGSIKFTYVMETELTNMYHITETLPTTPARYYQISVQDPSNLDGLLRIGTVLFGSSLITTPKACFINPVQFGNRHFKDTLETEGYTSVSNDRALRKFLSLTYTSLQRTDGNFGLLRDYYLTAKTDLKCLIIPAPQAPSALAVFAKLSQLPEEQHTVNEVSNWLIDLTLDWDESL